MEHTRKSTRRALAFDGGSKEPSASMKTWADNAKSVAIEKENPEEILSATPVRVRWRRQHLALAGKEKCISSILAHLVALLLDVQAQIYQQSINLISEEQTRVIDQNEATSIW